MVKYNLDQSLVMKYSNSFYATKDDLKEDANIDNIDDAWEDILSYRSNFISTISLKHIDNKNLNLCLTPGISSLISNIERKLLKLTVSYFGLEKIGANYEFKKLSYFECLKSVSEKYYLNIDDASIRSIISSNSSVLSPLELQLNKYLKCLKLIESKHLQEIDKAFLFECYSLLTDNEGEENLYRSEELDLKKNINGEAFGVAVATIEDFITQLFSFINSNTLGPLLTATTALYFINYIRPFDLYSEDIGILLFKKILAFNDYGAIASMVDLESILNDEEFINVLNTSLKTYDLTYVVSYICNALDNLLIKAIDNIAIAKSYSLREEFYEQELDSSSKEESDVEETSNINTSVNIEQPRKEITSKIINQERTSTYSKGMIAFSDIPVSLSEEKAKILEKTLLELEPQMSKAQAYFYARHCTIGMNYKISDFVEAVGCAYETARTSMDNLVYLGYYQKNAYKNKYIYTPIKKN